MTAPLAAAQITRLKSKQQSYQLVAEAGLPWYFQAYACPDDDSPGLPVPVAICGEDLFGYSGQVLQFDGRRSYAIATGASIVSWLWTFGDGTSGTSSQPSHAYELPGTYEVVQFVTDSYTLMGQCQLTVEIAPGRSGGCGNCVDGGSVRVLAWGDDAGNAYWSDSGGNPTITRVLGARVTATAMHPSSEKVAYYGNVSGSVHATLDGLETIAWTCAVAAGQVRALATDPNAVNTVFCAIAGNWYRSTNYARTFSLMPDAGFGYAGTIHTIAIDPRDSQHILIGGEFGSAALLGESTDGGQTWYDITPSLLEYSTRINDLEFSRLPSTVLWVGSECTACAAGRSILRGERTWNGTWTWEAADNGPPEAVNVGGRAHRDTMAWALPLDTVILWQTVAHPAWISGGSIPQSTYVLKGDLDCEQTVWLGAADGLRISTDYGVSTSLRYSTPSGVSTLALGPLIDVEGSQYLGTDSYAKRIDDTGLIPTLVDAFAGLDAYVLLDPTCPLIAYGLIAATGAVYRSINRGNSAVLQGTVPYIPSMGFFSRPLACVDVAGTLYATGYSTDVLRVMRSENQGVSWSLLSGSWSGITPIGSRILVGCSITTPEYLAVAFVEGIGTYPLVTVKLHLARSTDSGASWTDSIVFTSDIDYVAWTGVLPEALAIAYDDTDGGAIPYLIFSQGDLATWLLTSWRVAWGGSPVLISSDPIPLGEFVVQHVQVDQSAHYVIASETSGLPQRVLMSTDRGVSWSTVTPSGEIGIPQRVAVSFQNPKRVYVLYTDVTGGDSCPARLYYRDSAQSSWTLLGTFQCTWGSLADFLSVG